MGCEDVAAPAAAILAVVTASKLRVAVVDDDPGIRHMLSLSLGEVGHDVLTHDGRGRLDLAGVNVVILDLRLGTTSARELLQAQPEIARLPIIVMTASEDSAEGLGLTSTPTILRKPFDLDELDHAIAHALAGDGSGSEARAG